METQIEVSMVIVNAQPPLRALADVKFSWQGGRLTVRRFAVFQKDGEPPWATVPRLRFERNGGTVYIPLLDLPVDLKRRTLDAVLAEYVRVRGSNGDSFPRCRAPEERATSVGPDDPRRRTARGTGGVDAGAGGKGPAEGFETED
jgi:hypothetical protein